MVWTWTQKQHLKQVWDHDHDDMDMSPITINYEPDNDPAIGGDATVTITLTDERGSTDYRCQRRIGGHYDA